MNKKFLLFLTLALVLSLCLSLVACNGNVKATVFNGRGELVNSANIMRIDFDYDEKLDTGFSESRCNRYYILLEENGVEKPDCRMDLQFLENS